MGLHRAVGKGPALFGQVHMHLAAIARRVGAGDQALSFETRQEVGGSTRAQKQRLCQLARRHLVRRPVDPERGQDGIGRVAQAVGPERRIDRPQDHPLQAQDAADHGFAAAVDVGALPAPALHPLANDIKAGRRLAVGKGFVEFGLLGGRLCC